MPGGNNVIVSRTTTVGSVIAILCWMLGFAVATADIFYEPDVGSLAVGFIAIALLLSIKVLGEESAATMRRRFTQLEEKVDEVAKDWHTAYEVGKEAGLRRVPSQRD